MKLHLDTDLGGDMDDVCALAMLLKWPEVDITGVTTVTDDGGRRAGYVGYMLKLAGRSDIPVAAGADVLQGYYRYKPGYPSDEVYWPEPISPQPGALDDALVLLKRSIEQGAVLVGIGQFTNFALLEKKYPGILKDANLYLMGGRVYDAHPGYPQWVNDYDYNIQLDAPSAHDVFEHSSPTVIPITVTCETYLRRADLPRLAQAGTLGELIVRQAEACASDDHFETVYGETCPALPRDLINFQHDPLACAIALGWRDGVQIDTVPLKFEIKGDLLYETPDEQGTPTRLVTAIDGVAFSEYWVDVICG